jgi:hypothetical protein
MWGSIEAENATGKLRPRSLPREALSLVAQFNLSSSLSLFLSYHFLSVPKQ